jgi:alpha-L-rhamnosidase
VKCSHRSVRGLIESNWTTTDQATSYEIVIPPDTTAIIELPTAAGEKLTEGGRPVADAPGITALPPGPTVHRLQVGSGRYQFSLQHRP